MSSNPNGQNDDWSGASQELFRAARSDHAPSAADRERVRRALAQRVAAAPSPPSEPSLVGHAVSNVSRLLKVGLGVSLVVVGTIAIKRTQEPTPSGQLNSQQSATRTPNAVPSDPLTGAAPADHDRAPAQAREDATQAREGEGASQARGGAAQAREGAAQARGGASQARGGASQAREGAAQVRDREAQTRGGASLAREGPAEARGGAAQARSVQLRDGDARGFESGAESRGAAGQVLEESTGARAASGSERAGAGLGRARAKGELPPPAASASDATQAHAAAQRSGDDEQQARASAASAVAQREQPSATVAADARTTRGETTQTNAATEQPRLARNSEESGVQHARQEYRAAPTAAVEADARTSRAASLNAQPAQSPQPEAARAEASERASSQLRIQTNANARADNREPSTDARAELTFVRKMQAALRAGEAQDVLDLSAEHQERWPHGTFVQEREGLRAIATCNTAAPNATANARTFLAKYPRTPLAPRVREACKLQQPKVNSTPTR